MKALLLALPLALASCAMLRPSPRAPEPQLMPSGLVIWDLLVVDGPGAEPGDELLVHYELTLLDGTPLDSSLDQGAPVKLVLGESPMVPGIVEGLTGMSASSRRRLQIPPELGFGVEGAGPVPANATLLATVEVVELHRDGLLDFASAGESH